MNKYWLEDNALDPGFVKEHMMQSIIQGFAELWVEKWTHYNAVLDNILLNGLSAELSQSDLDILKYFEDDRWNEMHAPGYRPFEGFGKMIE